MFSIFRHLIFSTALLFLFSGIVTPVKKKFLNLKIMEKIEGENATINCMKTDKVSITTKIEWSLNGCPLNEIPPNSRRFVTSNSISIRNLTRKDTGIYGCNRTVVQPSDINQPDSFRNTEYKYQEFYLKVLNLNLNETDEPVEIIDGHDVVIGCKYTKLSKPHVKWIKYDDGLPNERYFTLDNGDLLVREINLFDAGKYTCVVTHNNSTENISRTLLVKEYTKTEPNVIEVIEGSNVTFICTTANRSLYHEIDWFAEYNIIQFYAKSRFVKNNYFSLTITNINKYDSGLYTCLNKIDQKTTSIKLIVHDKPKPPVLRNITCDKKYASLAWSQGEPWYDDQFLIYTIEYKTSFAPDKWFIAIDNIKLGLFESGQVTIPITPGATFVFQIFTKHEYGKSDPSASGNCTTEPDVPYKNPGHVKVTSTDPTNIIVNWTPMPEVEHNAPGFGYQILWKRDKPGYDWNFEIITDYTKNELVINRQPTYQRYKINVIAFNNKGKSIKPPKQIVGYSGVDALIITFEGNNVIIGCINVQLHKLLVKWTKNHTELTGGRYTTFKNGSLRISEVTPTDSGEYTCVATNYHNSDIAFRPLIVKALTKIVIKPKDVQAAVGSSAIFYCSAIADQSLRLNIEWLTNGNPLNFNNDIRFVKTNNYSLEITKVKKSDFGTYTCLAKTEMDQKRVNATLVVQDKPNPPQLLEVTCNRNNADLKWKSNGDNYASISGYIIEYNTNFDNNTWSIASNNIPEFNHTVTVPLKPWTNFTFRVIAINKIGRSNPSIHSNICITEPDVPYENPENVIITSTNLTNLIFRWTPMSINNHNGPGFGYKIFWKQDKPNYDWNSTKITNYTIKEFIIHNQPTYQWYRVKIVAFNRIGESNAIPKEFSGYLGKKDKSRWFILMLFAVLLFVLVTMVAIFLLVIKCCMERVKRDIDCKQHDTYSGDTDPNETYVYEYSQLHMSRKSRNAYQFSKHNSLSTTEHLQ